MAENFQLSLQVTVLGMGLVILTLLIIAAIIMLLGRIFRAKPQTGCEVKTGDSETEEPDTVTPNLISAPQTSSQSDEATAIALAIALQRTHRKAPSMRANVTYEETEVVGEVVNVVSIEPGASVWSGTSRLLASK
jgi:Na+-transporting methylmalonyl-CoA/oxaloacetate decarboxylase gamma subunit